MSRSERRLFDAFISQSRCYVEFGTGGSTLRALAHSNAQVHAVESSTDWLRSMRQYAAFRAAERTRLHIVLVDIGPVGDYGYPANLQDDSRFGLYSSEVFERVDCNLVDRALIDGRFRVACTLQTILKCHSNPHLRIMIHDFWNRPQYHCVLPFLETQRRIDTAGVFRVRRDVDLESVRNLYEAFRAEPD